MTHIAIVSLREKTLESINVNSALSQTVGISVGKLLSSLKKVLSGSANYDSKILIQRAVYANKRLDVYEKEV